MALDTKIIQQLREMTGAGLADCKVALDESGGDIPKAIEILRKKGAVKAAKKTAERTAGEGLVGTYVHSNGKIGVLVKVLCETDFVARNVEFQEFVHDLALQIAATSPTYLKPEEVPTAELEKEKEIYREQLKSENKPADVVEKIIVGKLEKYYSDVCLLKQPFIKDDKITVEQLVAQKIATIGEKIEVVGFSRLAI